MYRVLPQLLPAKRETESHCCRWWALKFTDTHLIIALLVALYDFVLSVISRGTSKILIGTQTAAKNFNQEYCQCGWQTTAWRILYLSLLLLMMSSNCMETQQQAIEVVSVVTDCSFVTDDIIRDPSRDIKDTNWLFHVNVLTTYIGVCRYQLMSVWKLGVGQYWALGCWEEIHYRTSVIIQ